MQRYYTKLDSPVGTLTLIASSQYLEALLWEGDNPKRVPTPNLELNPNHPILKRAQKQLNEYFAKRRSQFDIPYQFTGTDFQNKVWKELSRIPYGEKRSYSEIARRVKSPHACRAVGMANGRNPISIIVPCHRVIGASGDLTGFAAGLKIKKFLLDLES